MKRIFNAFKDGDLLTRISFFIFGLSNFFRGQIIKGLIFFASEILFIYYFLRYGLISLMGLRHLGVTQQGWVFDESRGIDILQSGDNSMLILLYGVFAIFIIAAFLLIW